MDKNENIHIKLEIGKDSTSGKLTIMTKFNSNAPNFIKEEEGFAWAPTPEERKFLNEAFDMFGKK